LSIFHFLGSEMRIPSFSTTLLFLWFPYRKVTSEYDINRQIVLL
jgi:hypothetical protein